jgi:hypothetical protein
MTGPEPEQNPPSTATEPSLPPPSGEGKTVPPSGRRIPPSSGPPVVAFALTIPHALQSHEASASAARVQPEREEGGGEGSIRRSSCGLPVLGRLNILERRHE